MEGGGANLNENVQDSLETYMTAIYMTTNM